jgi:hypothetical protein
LEWLSFIFFPASGPTVTDTSVNSTVHGGRLDAPLLADPTPPEFALRARCGVHHLFVSMCLCVKPETTTLTLLPARLSLASPLSPPPASGHSVRTSGRSSARCFSKTDQVFFFLIFFSRTTPSPSHFFLCVFVCVFVGFRVLYIPPASALHMEISIFFLYMQCTCICVCVCVFLCVCKNRVCV